MLLPGHEQLLQAATEPPEHGAEHLLDIEPGGGREPLAAQVQAERVQPEDILPAEPLADEGDGSGLGPGTLQEQGGLQERREVWGSSLGQTVTCRSSWKFSTEMSSSPPELPRKSVMVLKQP